jgi:hypothetical protein
VLTKISYRANILNIMQVYSLSSNIGGREGQGLDTTLTIGGNRSG